MVNLCNIVSQSIILPIPPGSIRVFILAQVRVFIGVFRTFYRSRTPSTTRSESLLSFFAWRTREQWIRRSRPWNSITLLWACTGSIPRSWENITSCLSWVAGPSLTAPACDSFRNRHWKRTWIDPPKRSFCPWSPGIYFKSFPDFHSYSFFIKSCPCQKCRLCISASSLRDLVDLDDQVDVETDENGKETVKTNYLFYLQVAQRTSSLAKKIQKESALNITWRIELVPNRNTKKKDQKSEKRPKLQCGNPIWIINLKSEQRKHMPIEKYQKKSKKTSSIFIFLSVSRPLFVRFGLVIS